MKKPLAALTLAALLLAPAPALAQTGETGLDKITAYAGDWNTTIVQNKTPYSEPSTKTTHLHNDCWRSGEYYTCHQTVDGMSAGLIIFTYDAKHEVYRSHNIPPDGSDGGSGTLKITGDTWTFPWQIQDGSKIVYFRVVNVFHGPDAIEYRREFSSDQKTWTVAATGHESRLQAQQPKP